MTQESEEATQLSPRQRSMAGAGTALAGIVTGILMVLYPEGLKVPLWVGIAACGVFVVAGIALASQGHVSKKFYDAMIAVLVFLMICIPAWIALGPGTRTCTGSFGLVNTSLGCRIGFGFSLVLLIGVLFLVVKSLFQNEDKT